MFASGVPEKIVGEVTGHKSLKALRTYERTSEEQKRAAGRAISNLSVFKCEEIEQSTSTEHCVDKNAGSKVELEQSTSTECAFKNTGSDMPTATSIDVARIAVTKMPAQLPQISGTLSNCTFNFHL